MGSKFAELVIDVAGVGRRVVDDVAGEKLGWHVGCVASGSIAKHGCVRLKGTE